MAFVCLPLTDASTPSCASRPPTQAGLTALPPPRGSDIALSAMRFHPTENNSKLRSAFGIRASRSAPVTPMGRGSDTAPHSIFRAQRGASKIMFGSAARPGKQSPPSRPAKVKNAWGKTTVLSEDSEHVGKQSSAMARRARVGRSGLKYVAEDEEF